jgi:hypothetical protein
MIRLAICINYKPVFTFQFPELNVNGLLIPDNANTMLQAFCFHAFNLLSRMIPAYQKPNGLLTPKSTTGNKTTFLIFPV